MNGSLISADRSTHGKIVVIALAAAIAVVWVGLTAHVTAGDARAERPHPIVLAAR
jgi:hypothetical protein